MIDSIFRVMYSLLVPPNSVKKIAEQYRMMEEGQKAKRKARKELYKLQQERPKYPPSSIGLYQQEKNS